MKRQGIRENKLLRKVRSIISRNDPSDTETYNDDLRISDHQSLKENLTIYC